MSVEIYHQAARDGYLDLLREATRKDCDRPDEDGMTPTLWAAYHGNLDALRLLVSRGGNPDKCDHLGCSALHHAASNGHMHCVTYLVSFGANIWAMDNEFHTPIDVSGINNRTEIVKFLDRIITQQIHLNKKIVKKLKEKAVLNAQKRVRRYEKLQAKAQKKAMKEEKKLSKERQKMGSTDSSSSLSSSTLSKRSDRYLRNTVGGRRSSTKSEPMPYSAHFTINSNKKKGGVARRLRQRSNRSESSDNGVNSEFKVSDIEMDGTKTVRSLSGLRRDSHIMYVRGQSVDGKGNEDQGRKSSYTDNEYIKVRDDDAISRAISEPDLAFVNNGDSGVDSDSNPPESMSIFERPGFGSVAFMNRRMTHGTLMSLPQENGEDTGGEDGNRDSAISSPSGEAPKPAGRPNGTAAGKIRRKSSFNDIDSIGTIGSLAARIKDMPWEDEDLLLDDDDPLESSPLELFLASNGLTEFISLFSREKIDLDALMLVSEVDLREMGLPLGPKLKLLDAIARRKQVLARPGPIVDSVL